MPQEFVNGVQLFYTYRPARGPGVVFVHGLAATLAFWYLRIIPLLSQELTVVLYDLRGHGQSAMPPTGYTTLHMAEDLHGILEHLNLRTVHLVGHSFGGAIALHYTVLHPERIASLTLADSRIWSLQPLARGGARSTDDHTGVATWGDPYLDALGQPDMGMPLLTEGGAPAASALLPNRNGRAAHRWLQLIRTTTAPDQITQVAGLTPEVIRDVRQPVLLMYGEHSHCLPSCQRMAEQLRHSLVVLVPNAGHFHPITRPSFFAKELTNFVGSQAIPQ